MKNKNCELDPIPVTVLLKKGLDKCIDIITRIVNTSLTHGMFPIKWKTAIVRLLLKKPGLKPISTNYRPVSNLAFLSKVVEKAALIQFIEHCEEN